LWGAKLLINYVLSNYDRYGGEKLRCWNTEEQDDSGVGVRSIEEGREW